MTPHPILPKHRELAYKVLDLAFCDHQEIVEEAAQLLATALAQQERGEPEMLETMCPLCKRHIALPWPEPEPEPATIAKINEYARKCAAEGKLVDLSVEPVPKIPDQIFVPVASFEGSTEPAPTSGKTLGEIAWDTYAQNPIDKWEALPRIKQKAWEQIAQAVADFAIESYKKSLQS